MAPKRKRKQSASSADEKLGTFGQKTPPLLKHIQNILQSYTDGQILKELTQNAEDAGATTVQFLYDVHGFDAEKLYHDRLRPHQGSALYSYNDAYFKPEDWDGIQKPSDSGKKKDPLKVGRFGIGFVSVYHMTDVPSILSGNYLAYMDPTEKIFSPKETGFRFVLDDTTQKHLRIVNDQRYSHQFTPYNSVFDDNTIFPGEMQTIDFQGTLFRFPLRKHKSDISKNVYDSEKANELLLSFSDDASLILLFLKNIETVNVFTRNSDSKKTLEISATLSDDTAEDVRTARRRICDGVKNHRQKEDLAESYKMTIDVCSSDITEGNKRNWFVCTYICWPQDVEIQMTSKEEGLSAWVGVAMSLDSVDVKGRTFCFLPLPPEESSTCLPVHVNGAFAVSPDRRSIKWPSEDRIEDNSALWNKYLVGTVLPKAYAKLIVDAVSNQSLLVECIYKAWPDITKPLGHWEEMVEPMMCLLKSESVFYTKASGGKWVDASEAVFDYACRSHPVHKTLVELLIKLNKPVVTPPDHVYNAVKQYIDSDVDEVTPRYTRECIRNLSLDDVDRKEKLMLLEYILQDECYTDLEGIALLPLADKTFATFERPRNESCEIYITTKQYPIELFFNVKEKFLDDDNDIGESLRQHADKIASSNKDRRYGVTSHDMQPRKKRKLSNTCTGQPMKDDINDQDLPQISHLTVDAVVRIVQETLPKKWHDGKEVEWTPGQNQHPPTTWLKLCWDMLNNDFNENLQDFPQLPLIPKQMTDNAMEIRLVPLRKISYLISASTTHDGSIDPKVETVLEKIGLKVVHLQSFTNINRHPRLYSQEFVHYPTPEGVVKALKALPVSEISRSLDQLTQMDKEILRTFMSEISRGSIHKDSEEYLRYRMLPIFLSFPDKELFSSSNIRKVVKAMELPNFATTEKMIGLYDTTDDIFASVLQLEVCSRDEAIFQMLDIVSENYIEELIKWIVERWTNNQSTRLISKLKTTPFLKTSDDKIKRPCDLFDPTDEVVSTLWDDGEGVFPVEYIDKDHIHILKDLDLKDRRHITVEDVISRAKRIETYGLRDKARSLLKFLNKRDDLVSPNLENIKWVPVLCQPKWYHLTWGCKEVVVKPTEVLTSAHIRIAGSSIALIDSNGTELNNSILKRFRWDELPQESLVINQLVTCIGLWDDEKLDFNNETKILQEIYTYFQERLNDDIKEELSNMKCIWQGNKFVEARKVSIEEMRLDMAPYVYQVPRVFVKFERLFRSCGSHRKIDTDAMLNIIEKIKDKHAKTNIQEEAKEDIQFVIKIICHIVSEQEETEIDTDRILLPDDNTDSLRLHPVSEMCYCDMDDYEKEDLPDDDQSTPVYLTHENIPPKVCIRLGVIPLSKRLADAEEFEGIEQTGQSEPLTVRLRNILQGYEANDIPKELIQNADDAKATEVRFLIDFRQNQNYKGKLLDPGMERCQGPALWVQNNSTFSKEDFENITRLGSQSKMTIREKVGRFGLGFNSVYHLTDVPSFISGDKIVFFDPHAIHLGKQIRDKTKLGIMLNFAKSTKQLSRFKGQFEPYNGVFDCNLQPTSEWKSYNGTLFRFPLRTELQARDNEIKNDPCNDEKILKILQHFQKEAEDILLFTNHVKEVSLHILPQNATDPTTTTELFRISTTQKENFVTASMITSEKGNDYLGDQRSVTKQWIMQNSDGLYPLEGHDVNESDAVRIANSDFGLRHGLNPRGGVVCPLGNNTSNGLVYCFLPLSIPLSNLPVYINASFSLSSDRRNLKKLGARDEENLDIQWNNAIMKNTITKCYIDLLSKGECGNIVSEDAARKGDVFFFWPKTHVHPDYELIVKEFYRMVVDGDGHSLPLIFRKNDRWYDFKHLVIIDPDLKKIPNVGHHSMEILVQLLNSEQTAVIDIPEWLYGILSSDHRSALEKQTVSKDQFFHKYFFPNIGKFDDQITDKIILYVLRVDEYHELVKSTSCIPSTPNGKVRKRISELISPTGRVSKMYSADENVFPFGEYNGSEIIQKLTNLCLRMDVKWSDVVERAKTVPTLQEISADIAVERTKAIVNYTYHKHKKDKNGIESFREDIKYIRFFPSMLKPNDYPISWLVDRVQLFSPNDLYTKVNADLVGSLYPIIDENIFGFQKDKSLIELFGISQHPAIPDILKQLDKLLECDLTNSNIKSVKRIYVSILENIDSDTHNMEQLKNKQVVLVDDHFVKGSICARHGLSGNISGLLYIFPKELNTFWNFFRKLGVLKKFGVSDYINAICRLNIKARNKQLDSKDVDAVIQILTHLEKEMHETSDLKDLLIPDVENILHPVNKLCYNDIRFKRPFEDVKICSGKISQNMAERFGIKDIRTRAIMNLSCNLFCEFGQREELTSRISRILEGYPLDVSFLREMLQNADDAGASKLSLILDHRSHPLGELPSNNWKHLQGPALCIYNNAIFNDDDIRGIQKLGSGSKENQADKTGQYGVGFNVVYHVTDCPSFISDGEIFCLFDPNLEYAPGATSINPGMMTKKLQEVRQIFTNAMNCYLNEFEQDFPQKGGTIFRLPLRSDEMAKLSTISNQHITENCINDLLTEFEREMPEILLFLKNIRQISVHEINTSGELIEKYSVESVMHNRNDEERRISFMETSLKAPASDKINQMDCCYEIEITCHNSVHREFSQRWLISQSFGFGNSDYHCGLSRPHLQIGGVCALLPHTDVSPNFDHNGSVYCFLPLPIKSGLPVIVNGHFCLGHESRRDIWNDDDGKSDPRVIWNNTLITVVVCRAYLNLLKEFAKRIGLSGSPSDKITETELERRLNDYHLLFPDPSKTSSTPWKTLAESFYKRIVDENENVLPLLKQNSSDTECITPNEIKWTSPVGNTIDKGYFYRVDSKKQEGLALRSLLIRLGINVLYAPFEIYEFFKAAGCRVESVTPNHVCEFLSTNHGKCTIVELPKPIAETTIRSKNDLKILMEYICNNLGLHGLHPHGIPLILTEDNYLNVCDCQTKYRQSQIYIPLYHPCTFGKRNIFYSRFAHVFPECKDEFLHKEFMEFFDASKFKSVSLTDIEQRLAKHLNMNKYRRTSYIDNESGIVKPNWIKGLWNCIFSSWNFTPSFFGGLSPNSAKVEELIREFSDWAILPVRFKDKAYLVPLSMADTVTTLGCFTYDILACTKLNCPKLCVELLPERIPINVLLSSPEHPERIVSLLHFLQQDDEQCFNVLEPRDCRDLLNYFERKITYLKTNAIFKLKELKLFETISGDIVSLSNKRISDVLLIHDDIPKDDQSIWLGKTQTVFIKRQLHLETLYNKLGFDEKSSLQVYLRFILPWFSDFTDNGREAHLKWIRGKRLDKEELLEMGLTSTPVIKIDNGFQRVNTLYNPDVNLFKVMLPMHSFPPSPYDAPEWKEFLINLGLITEVSQDLFIEFATHIENLIPTNTVQSRKMAKALVKALSHSGLNKSSFLGKISTIKFMLPDDLEVRKLLPDTSTCEISNNGIMFRGSVVSTHAHLVWTTKPVLPAYASKIEGISSHLGVIQNPNTEDVLMHLKNIGLSTNTERRISNDNVTNIKQVYTDIYAFLNQQCDCNYQNPCPVCQSISKKIPPKLAFILVYDIVKSFILVPASVVSEYVPNEIKDILIPYIYELPKEFANYGTIFKAAGMTDKLNLKQYSFVLEAVFKDDNTGGRNPNFKKVVATCVRNIIEMLKHSKEEGIELDFESVDHLYFPDKEHALISSRDLVYADVCSYEDRIKGGAARLFIGFQEFKLDENYFKYLDVLPKRLQLQKMSEEFREQMLVAECKDCPEYKNGHCDLSDTYQAVLTSHEFRQGLMRLINHEKRHSDFDKKATEQKIEALFGQALKLHCNVKITTQLYYRDILLNGSEETTECCLVKTKNKNELNNYDIYIYHDKHPGSKIFLNTLVKIINGMLGNEITDTLPLQAIVTEQSPFTIHDTLSKLNITSYEGRPYEPPLGERVPVDSLYLLSEDPFDTFYPGEIVAYQLSDIDDNDSKSNYIYAKIKCKISSDNVDRLNCRYAIDIGDEEGPIEVSVLDIFKFRKPERAIGLEVVLYEGQDSQSTSYEGTKDEVKNRIKKELEEIWRLHDPERRKAIRRILLKWHPDKNDKDRKEFYTEMFQYIQNVIKELEAGRGIGLHLHAQSRGNRGSRRTGSRRTFDDDFYNDINRRAQRDHTFFHHNQQSGHTSTGSYYRYGYYGSQFATQQRTTPTDVPEARRWLRQAEIDLSAAETEGNSFCEWICFKCSQAAEKAFKAAQYAIDGEKMRSHCITSLANQISSKVDLTSAADRLVNAAGNQMRMRYPDMVYGDKIPNDVYTIREAEESKSAAREIVNGISEFINRVN